MNDPFGVGGIKGVSDVNGDGKKYFHFQRTPGDAVLQRPPVQKLHGDERFAVLVVNFVDRADVGMVQCRGRLGFALETAECLRVFGYVVGQELEGHKAIELHVLGLVDHTHPAAAQLLDDAVMGEGFADQGSGAIRRVRALLAGKSTRGHFYRLMLQEASCLVL